MDFTQENFDIRCEWGLEGIQALQTACAVFIIVDVLSFCTAVSIAVERGALIYPCQDNLENCAEFAQQEGALLARKSDPSSETFSLSPSSMLKIEAGQRLVLPSPNGSRLSLAVENKPVLAGCLRNARAVAQAAQGLGQPIGVIAAGERWHYGEQSPLRPSLEDQLGAGAIIHYLTGCKSPEAEAAQAVFEHFAEKLPETLRDCGSGRELIRKGLSEDIHLAAELNSSAVVPFLDNGQYRALD